MKTSVLKLVREMFIEKNELTLNEIYQRLSQRSDLEIKGGKLHHRVRSTIYALKKSGKIKRVSGATYRMED